MGAKRSRVRPRQAVDTIAKQPASSAKGDWIVRMRRTVITDVIVNNCTKAEATADPFGHSDNETEVDQEDFEVLEVSPND